MKKFARTTTTKKVRISRKGQDFLFYKKDVSIVDTRADVINKEKEKTSKGKFDDDQKNKSFDKINRSIKSIKSLGKKIRNS